MTLALANVIFIFTLGSIDANASATATAHQTTEENKTC